MSAFNAGAIEAKLTLGRSDWTKDLRKTKKEIEDLERQSITIGLELGSDDFDLEYGQVEEMLDELDGKTYTPKLDLDIEAAFRALELVENRLEALDRQVVAPLIDADTDNFYVQTSLVEEELALLENDTVNIPVDLDADGFRTKMVELQEEIAAINGEQIDISVDMDMGAAEAQMAALQTQIEFLDGQDISIDVDYDEAAFAGLVGSGGADGGHLGLLKILLMAIIALSPVLSVAIGAMSASVIGFVAAVAGAAGPVGVLALGLALLIKQFTDAKKAGDELTGPMETLSKAWEHLKDVKDEFVKGIGDAGFGLLAQALNLVADVLPDLVPLFNLTAGVLSDIFDRIDAWIGSPGYKGMLDFFGTFGIDMLETFIDIGGNLLVFFGRLFQAIAPFATQMMHGLREVTAGWAEWADDLDNNQSFQHFVQNAEKYGPMVLDLLGSIIAAFINLGHALEPFAGPMLQGLTFLFDVIANMDPNLLTALVGGFAALYLGVNVIGPAALAAGGGIEALAGALGIAVGPLLLIVAAIAGLGAMIFYLWKTNEDFRNHVKEVWADIQDTIGPIIDDITSAIQDNWGPITEWAQTLWDNVSTIFADAFDIILSIVQGALDLISGLWANYGNSIILIVSGFIQSVGSIIGGLVQTLRGIMDLIDDILHGRWNQIGGDIRNIVMGLVNAVTGMFRGALKVWSGVFGAIRTALTNVWNGMIGGLRNAWNGFSGFITGRFNALVNTVRGMPGRIASAAAGMWNGIKNGFRDAINTVIRWWNGLSLHIPGFDPPGPGPKFGGITISTPDIGLLAKGGYITDPMLAVIGEGPTPEIAAPEPVLERIVRDNSGDKIDYNRLAGMVANAVAAVVTQLGRGVTPEELQQLIDAASVNLNFDVKGDDGASAQRFASSVMFQLRVLGYGGKANV